MRPAFHILLSALALPLVAAPAHARQALTALASVPAYRPATPAPDTLKLQRMMTEADEASLNGREAHARRIYRSLIDAQRSANLYAGTALWRLAAMQLYDNKLLDAATTLDQAAQEAARYGDPTMEIKATFEAAIVWQKVRRNDLAMSHLERVRALLQSPVIDDELKASIQRRIVG